MGVTVLGLWDFLGHKIRVSNAGRNDGAETKIGESIKSAEESARATGLL